MSRSKWKGPFIEKFLVKKLAALKQKKSKRMVILKIWSRASVVCSEYVNFRFQIYNGKEFFPLSIVPEMVGHKLGEFVPTRAKYEYKKKKKKKK